MDINKEVRNLLINKLVVYIGKILMITEQDGMESSWVKKSTDKF